MRHNDECVKCSFFVVPGYGPVLFRMLDIEFLGVIRVKCETKENKTAGRKIDMQARHAAQSKLQTFSLICCFEDTFSLQVKDGSYQYEVPPRRVAYALQKPLKVRLEQLQKQQIIVP